MKTELKRDEIKYIRDLSKSAYKKGTECYICGETENLQFHHFYSLTPLWEQFKRKARISINSLQDILDYREQFKSVHHKEIYDDVITLCKFHHMERLHKVYGKSPPLATAEKQRRWVEIQKEKHRNESDK
jgi:hypothetical protein